MTFFVSKIGPTLLYVFNSDENAAESLRVMKSGHDAVFKIEKLRR